MKFTTEIKLSRSGVQVSPDDPAVLIGSCFTDGIGSRMREAGMDVLVNPFGTLYNPASIALAVSRLDSDDSYTEADCVQMGAGAGLVCSFEHHTSFARSSREEFLDAANSALASARAFWLRSTRVIITLGTAYVWTRDGKVVSNCLKRPGYEFGRKRLDISRCSQLLGDIVHSHPEKQFIFTVSPIRHLGGGAHENTLSKATLQLAVDGILESREGLSYFPAYELLLDELRDYRFYAADLVHPRDIAVDYIWEKFRLCCIPGECREEMDRNLRLTRQAAHRPMHRAEPNG